jgi:hypothetical protein
MWAMLAVALAPLGSAPSMPVALVDEYRNDLVPIAVAGTVESLRGGYMNLQLSPHCVRAIVSAAVACSQVGPAGLAGCGVLLHMTQSACS